MCLDATWLILQECILLCINMLGDELSRGRLLALGPSRQLPTWCWDVSRIVVTLTPNGDDECQGW